MTSKEELLVARMLRVALGYESREVRIGHLKSMDLEAGLLMKRLELRGLVNQTSVKEVFIQPSRS